MNALLPLLLASQMISGGTESPPAEAIRPPGDLRWLSLGRGDALQPVVSSCPRTDGARTVRHFEGGHLESWERKPLGLEHVLEIARRPPGGDEQGDLILELGVREGSRLRADGTGRIVFVDGANVPRLTYGDLRVFDANGRRLVAELSVSGERLRISFGDAGATYPLTVDPLMQAPFWTAEGEQPGALFGHSAASAGDVNGDGYDDVIAGAPDWSGELPFEGAAFLYLGSPTGPQPLPAWRAEGNAYWPGYGGPDFGAATAGAGDVNGDGFDDVIVGSPNFSGPGDREGRAQLFLGSSSGLAPAPAWTAIGSASLSLFGHSVASAGDVNNDGYDDVLVGAPHFSASLNSTWGGRVYLYLGSPSGLAPAPAWTYTGLGFYDFAGWSVASAGDVNGDGYDDVLSGSAGSKTFSNAEGGGRVHAFYGSAAGLPSTPSWTALGSELFGYFGWSVASAGDVNGDTYDDIVIGAYEEDNRFVPAQADEGRAYVYLGSASGLAAPAVRVYEGNQLGAEMGWDAAGAGDVNQDGYADILVSAYEHDISEDDEGVVYLYLGSPTGPSATPAWSAAGGQEDAKLADVVRPAGDVNGDGFADFLLGTQLFDRGETDEGIVSVYMSTCGSADFDGDGIAPAGDPLCSPAGLADCDDAIGDSWATPGEAANLRLTHDAATDTTTIVWSLPALPGGSESRFDVLRSADAADFTAAADCLLTNQPATSVAEPASPALGQIDFYLVRAVNGCPAGLGPLGLTSAGVPRAGRACP